MDLTDKATVKKITKACFPEYRGRKIRVVEAKSYQMMDYWSEGTRHYVQAFDLATGEVSYPKPAVQNPFNGAAHARFEIPEGVAIVEHSIFCGKDAGISIYVAPTGWRKSIPEGRGCTMLSLGDAK